AEFSDDLNNTYTRWRKFKQVMYEKYAEVISKIAQICPLEFLSISCNSKGIKQTSKFYNMRDTTLYKITDSCPNLQYLKLESSKLSDISLEK
ncbi:14451_t:CDS:2, partial [Dentiscutata erythropus]